MEAIQEEKFLFIIILVIATYFALVENETKVLQLKSIDILR